MLVEDVQLQIMTQETKKIMERRGRHFLVMIISSYFSLAALNNRLVLVGGKDRKSFDLRSNILGVWDEKARRWCHPYPPMPTPRSGAAVATQGDKWLVVSITAQVARMKLKFSMSFPNSGTRVVHYQYICII